MSAPATADRESRNWRIRLRQLFLNLRHRGLLPAACFCPPTTYPAQPQSPSSAIRPGKQPTAADPGVIGSTFYIQNQPFTIVGISPPGFFGDRIDSNPPALWIPLNDEPYHRARDQHSETARHQLALCPRPRQARNQSRQPAGQALQRSAPVAGHAARLHRQRTTIL